MTENPEEHNRYSNLENFPPPSYQPPPPRVRVVLPDSRPVVTYAIMAITVLIYLLQMGADALFGYDIVAVMGMKINEYIYLGEYWRLITPVFLHANLMHIAFNMYALNALGPQLERFYGRWQFLLLYLTSGFGGVVASFALTEGASVGASTAIFGLLGALGVFSYQNQEVFGERARRSLRSIIQIAAINLLIGFTPGIDNWGHMGGLAAGVIIASLGGPLFKVIDAENYLQAENSREDSQFLSAIFAAFLIFGTIAGYLIFTN